MDKTKFYGLDHLRALAIILVLLYHYRMFSHPEWIDTIGWIGWTGVDLFFVLSGFLISNQLFQEIKKNQNIDLKIFFTKRFFRIIPPYFVTLMLYFCFPFFRERESLPSFWKFISFTQNYGLNVIEKGTFSHAWSLCIEEQFYLLLPVLLLIFIKVRRIHYLPFGALILIGISISLRYFSWNEYILPHLETSDFWREWYMKIYYPTYTRFDGLAIGVLIGYFYQFHLPFKAIINKNGNYLIISGILLIVFSLWFCRDQYSEKVSVLGFTFVAMSYGILLLGAISTSSFLTKKSNYFTSQLAVLSYSIYLSHKGIIHLVQLFLEKKNINDYHTLTVIICFCACIIVSIFYRLLIEKPSARIKNLLIDKN